MVREEIQKKRILVIGAEEIYYEVVRHFPAARYRLDFAGDSDEADARRRDGPPDLLILPWASITGRIPRCLSRARTAGRAVLALHEGPPPPPDEWPAALVDRVVDRRAPKLALEAARALLGERRGLPRAQLEMDLDLGPHGPARLLDLSARTLRVRTDADLAPGQPVPITVTLGNETLCTSATVSAILTEEPGEVVLRLSEEDALAAALERTIRRALARGHGAELDPGWGYVQGPVAWQLLRDAQRAERRLRAESHDDASALERAARVGCLETRYALGDRVGRWGVGEVYRATQRHPQRPVLVKRLREDLKPHQPAWARLELEARAGSALADIPGVAAVLDFGSDADGGLYYVMAPLEGLRLAEAVKAEGPLEPLAAARLGAAVALALVQARRRGFAHGDLSPETVFLQRLEGEAFRPLLMGFSEPALVGDPDGSEEGQRAAARDAGALADLVGRLVAVEPRAEAEESLGGRDAARLKETLRGALAPDVETPNGPLEHLAVALLRCAAELQGSGGGSALSLEAPLALLALPSRATIPSVVGGVLAEHAQEAVAAEAGLSASPSAACREAGVHAGWRRVVGGFGSAVLAVAAALFVTDALQGGDPGKPLAVRTSRTRSLATALAVEARNENATPSAPAVADLRGPTPPRSSLGAAMTEPGPHDRAPRDPAARRRGYLRLGRWLVEHGEPAKALRYLRKALRLGDSAELRRLLATGLVAGGEPAAAVPHLKEAIRLEPGTASHHIALGRVYLILDDRWLACQALRAAATLSPQEKQIKSSIKRHCLRAAPRARLLPL